MAPNITIHQYGCFLISIANLFQVDPLELLKVPNGFDAEGNLFPEVLARACGGTFIGSTVSSPHGWQIAVTSKYASLGYPTHFFCVNLQENKQIDPLKFPVIIEPITYTIVQFRTFSGTRLDDRDPTYPIIPQTVPPVVEVQNLEKRLETEQVPARRFSLLQLINRLRALFHLP